MSVLKTDFSAFLKASSVMVNNNIKQRMHTPLYTVANTGKHHIPNSQSS